MAKITPRLPLGQHRAIRMFTLGLKNVICAIGVGTSCSGNSTEDATQILQNDWQQRIAITCCHICCKPKIDRGFSMFPPGTGTAVQQVKQKHDKLGVDLKPAKPQPGASWQCS